MNLVDLLRTLESGLDSCFNLEANLDQTGRAFVQDIVMSMFDEGSVAIVPIDTRTGGNTLTGYDIILCGPEESQNGILRTLK